MVQRKKCCYFKEPHLGDTPIFHFQTCELRGRVSSPSSFHWTAGKTWPKRIRNGLRLPDSLDYHLPILHPPLHLLWSLKSRCGKKSGKSRCDVFWRHPCRSLNAYGSRQISIIPKPELRGFWGSSLIKPPFRVTSADVVIICPEWMKINM